MAYVYSTEPRPVWLRTPYAVHYTFPAWGDRTQTYYGQTRADASQFARTVAESGGVALESFDASAPRLWGTDNVPAA